MNKAIEKFYNDNKQFPDFPDVLSVVEKVNEMKGLRLSPGDCQRIGELCGNFFVFVFQNSNNFAIITLV